MDWREPWSKNRSVHTSDNTGRLFEISQQYASAWWRYATSSLIRSIATWLQHNFEIFNEMYLGDMSPGAHKITSIKCKKNNTINQSSKCSDSKKIKSLANFFGGGGRSQPPCERPSNFIQSMDLARPEGFPALRQCLNNRNRSTRFRLMWAQRKSVGGSVWYEHTRASTGLVDNCCAVAMSPKGNSRGTWPVTQKTFFSVAHRFGARGRNMLWWPPDNYNRAAVSP